MVLPVPAPISDGDRERVAELLQQACGDGRITLEEFSVRVGAAWAASTEVELDLREVVTGEDEIEIEGTCLFGELKVIVPEGVEVELSGTSALSSEELRLAAVPRLPGTPIIRVRVNAWFSSVEVKSRRPGDGVREWVADNLGI
jgi:Domain of unknown function (DUF1707)/Cell wall-active antibiotics response 4TMS YvqF